MTSLPEIKEEILHVFPYGSKVYGTNNEKSDTDLIVVVKGDQELEYGIHSDEMNVTVYSDKTFRNLLEKHHIAALECIFSNETEYEFKLNMTQLRRSISAVHSNSVVKCKKKLTEGPDYNPYIGKKSLFHALRILELGIQIAKHGRIIDFSASNHYLDIIMSIDDWEILKNKFQPISNKLKSEFKKLAPLDKDINKPD